MTVAMFAYAAAVVLVAAIVRGFSGFGFSLLTIISLSLVMPTTTIVPAMFMLEIAAGLHLLPSIMSQVRWRSIGVLMAAIVAGMPIGVYALATVPQQSLKLALSVVVIVAAILLLIGYRLTRMPSTPETIGTGFVAGLLNGAFGIGGPPIIIFYLGSPLAIEAGRAGMIATFLGMDLVGLPLLWSFGLVDAGSLTLFAVLLPTLLIGIAIGNAMVGRLPESRVRQVVLCFLLAMAVIIGLQGLGWIPSPA